MATGVVVGMALHGVNFVMSILEKPVFAMFIIEEAIQSTGMGIYISMQNKQYVAASASLITYTRLIKMLDGVTKGTRRFYDVVGGDIYSLVARGQPKAEGPTGIAEWFALMFSFFGSLLQNVFNMLTTPTKNLLSDADQRSGHVITYIMDIADKIFVEPFEAFAEGTKAQAGNYIEVMQGKLAQRYKTGERKGQYVISDATERSRINGNIREANNILGGPDLIIWEEGAPPPVPPTVPPPVMPPEEEVPIVPPPEEVELPETATIRIEEREGLAAEVYMNGKYQGTTDITVTMPTAMYNPPTYEFEVRLEGYESESWTQEALPNKEYTRGIRLKAIEVPPTEVEVTGNVMALIGVDWAVGTSAWTQAARSLHNNDVFKVRMSIGNLTSETQNYYHYIHAVHPTTGEEIMLAAGGTKGWKPNVIKEIIEQYKVDISKFEDGVDYHLRITLTEFDDATIQYDQKIFENIFRAR